MLPAPHRLRRSADFTAVVRRGRRAGSPHLALHLMLPTDLGTAAPARIGVVVSKAVGTAVTRTRVKRRLRAVALGQLHRLPNGSLAVLRANPASAHASSAALRADLNRTLDRVLRGAAPPADQPGTAP